jgi:pimeloyl-ACP methyl ester carboxylesterase
VVTAWWVTTPVYASALGAARWTGVGRRPNGRWLAIAIGLMLIGCSPPIRVERREPRAVERELDSNVISTGHVSESTAIVLHRERLSEGFHAAPDEAIVSLHRTVVAGESDPDLLFALAEMAFHRAEETGRQGDFLSALVYAYAFLFPDDAVRRPSAFDPRFRTACDIYNRSLTWAFASADRSRVELRSGRFALPFGSIDVTFDPTGAHWGDQALFNFVPADELRIRGLEIRYRRPGIGSSLVADAIPPVEGNGFQVEPELKVPVTALLRMDASRGDLARGRLRATVEVHPAFEPGDVMIGGQPVPLEADTTTAFAFSLSDPKVWESELAGFFDGDFFDRTKAQLVGLEPYRPGQIPIVFIHGTGSSSGRWANLINDLQSDAVIRRGFQFWSFSYATGNPVQFSADQLRQLLQAAVRQLDPRGRDPALRQIVLIGHSQGGLLAKWQVIDSGSRLWDTMSSKPPEELRISGESAALVRRVFFVTPLPQVRRVIFIATPHHGSFVAESPLGQLVARLVTPRAHVMKALRDLTDDNPDDLRIPPGARFGSVWSMSSDNPLLQAFAATPVAPSVKAHSIIAIAGDGPVESGDDGVVSYQSAHIPEAASEVVVRAGHSVQSHPETVREVRRILLLHLAEACPTGCTPRTTAATPPTSPWISGRKITHVGNAAHG